jgi:hypothetical protein
MLSQWALIAFAAILFATGFAVIRRRSGPARMKTAALLAVSLIGVGAGYAGIQAERDCADRDFAAEFVKGLLQG